MWILVEQDVSFLLELYLLQHSHINPGFRPGLSLFGVAVEHKNLRNVELLLKHGMQAQSTGKRNGKKDSLSCLDLAVKKSSADIVLALLASGACAGKDTIKLAVQRGDLEIMKAVVSNRVDTATYSQAHGEALWAASFQQKLDILHWLLEKGAAVDTQCEARGNALQAACEQGHTSVVLVLLEHGADVKFECGLYNNALNAASKCGHISIVKMLLERGARVDACGPESHTALHAACKSGHQDIVQILLEAGAEVNAQGGSHTTALHAAVLGQGSSKILELLIEKGADVNLQLRDHGNVLQAACAVQCAQHGPGRYGDNQGAGFWASCWKPPNPCSAKVVGLLLNKGAHINAQGGKYGGALQAACARSCSTVVRLLLDKGADPIAEGGIYESINSAVESNHQVDIAGMVTEATAKSLEILGRHRKVAKAMTGTHTAGRTVLQEPRASSRHRCGIEEQHQMDIPKKATAQGAEEPLETSRSVVVRPKSPSSISSRKSTTQIRKDYSRGEPAPTTQLNFEFHSATSDTASNHVVKSTFTTNRTTGLVYNKAMEKTMSSLFGLKYKPQPRAKTQSGLDSKAMAKTMRSLFGLEYRLP